MIEKYIDAFNKAELTKGFTVDEFESFLKTVQAFTKSYKKGEHIVDEGKPIDASIMILHGTVLQTRNRPDGERAIYNILFPGETVGEIIMILPNRNEWSSDYVAKTECDILFFPKEGLIDILTGANEINKKLLVNFIASIGVYLEKTMLALRCLRHATIRDKIATYLYEMYLIEGKNQLELPFNREELASFFNIPQPSLSRELALMKRDGIIDFHKSTIKILDLETIKSLS